MATKEQFMKAIHRFIENDMLPRAEGNYKIILNTAKAAIRLKPEIVFERLRHNSLVTMVGAIDEHDNVDIDLLADVLSEGFGSDEFSFAFRLLGTDYTMHFSGADLQTIKRYV